MDNTNSIRLILKQIQKAVAKNIIVGPPRLYCFIFVGIPKLIHSLIDQELKDFNIRMEVWALRQSDSFTKEEWCKIQTIKLQKILTHAGKNVYYWGKVFQQCEFPQKSQTIEDLKKLPILTRRNLKQLLTSSMVARNLSRKRFSRATTSGSTGEPLHFFQDKSDIFRRQIGIVKEFLNFGIFMDRPLLILGLSTHKQVTPFGVRFTNKELENNEERQKIYGFLKAKRPVAATGTSSLLLRFADFAKKDCFVYTFQKIRYSGEDMTKEEKDRLSRAFNTTLFTQYGTRECSYIGMECAGGKLHLTPWINLVEIVNERGESVPPGTDGEIIVTYFENWVMPFIRYDIGDRGKINTEPCPCSRQTPTITFTGRSGGKIETPSGKAVAFLRISSVIAKNFHDAIARFQLEQTAPDKLIFRFIPSARYTSATDKQLTQTLQSLFYNEIVCELNKVSEILPNAEGKTPIFIKNFSKSN